MTMGATVQADVVGARADRLAAAMVSLSSQWVTIGAAGVAAVADNAGSAISNVATQVTRAGTQPLGFAKGGGTNALVRLKYPVGMTITAQLQVSCHGRSGGQEWEQRKSVQGLAVVTITASPATDEKSADGAFQYTYCDPAVHCWDRVACDELVFAVVVAFNGTGASPALAVMEGKVL